MLHRTLFIFSALVAGGTSLRGGAGRTRHVPVRVQLPPSGGDLRSATVVMCDLDWESYRADPSRLPMFHDLMTASGCVGGGAGDSYETTFGALEDEAASRGCGLGAAGAGAPGCEPAGLVFHESRCGSTLVANMLSALPYSLVYSESAPPTDVLLGAGGASLSPPDRLRALRVIVAAMGRPIAAAAAAAGAAGGDWRPHHLYLKLQ